MDMETIHVKLNPEAYFSKMKPEDSAAIATMCLEALSAKATELKELYMQLAKTYDIEMGMCDITLLVQVSAPKLPGISVRGLLGTTAGIKHALTAMTRSGLKELANMEKEEANDKEQG